MRYDVPYAERLSQLAVTGAQDATALLDGIRLEIVVADGEVLRSGVVPEATSVQVDPETDTLRVWRTVENGDGVLRPGMEVTVLSNVEAPSQ